MSPVAYHHIYRALRIPFTFQIKMVRYAHLHGVSAAARAFATTRKTVRKWLTRYQAHGTSGLHDYSKAPHGTPRKSPAAIEQQALQLRRLLPTRSGPHLATKIQMPSSSVVSDVQSKGLRRTSLQRAVAREACG